MMNEEVLQKMLIKKSIVEDSTVNEMEKSFAQEASRNYLMRK